MTENTYIKAFKIVEEIKSKNKYLLGLPAPIEGYSDGIQIDLGHSSVVVSEETVNKVLNLIKMCYKEELDLLQKQFEEL